MKKSKNLKIKIDLSKTKDVFFINMINKKSGKHIDKRYKKKNKQKIKNKLKSYL